MPALPHVRLAALPTPLQRGPELPGGVRLWVKRDDLTGLGLGGNKARKLEYLCGDALATGHDTLVTVGAGQSNHCRMTAAAGAVLGLPVHLVLAGAAPSAPAGNQLLAALFGATLHTTGLAEDDWSGVFAAADDLCGRLAAEGRRPYLVPIGGSTAVGALGYLDAWGELAGQCRPLDLAPAAVVTTSSSGGTHAGLLAGRAMTPAWAGGPAPDVLAIGVAKEGLTAPEHVLGLADGAVRLAGGVAAGGLDPGDCSVDDRWVGEAYAVPSEAGDDAVRWAGRRLGLALDRTYSGKGLAGLLGNAAEGRWPAGSDVVFLHTGGTPALFAPGGAPPPHP